MLRSLDFLKGYFFEIFYFLMIGIGHFLREKMVFEYPYIANSKNIAHICNVLRYTER